MDRGKNTSMTFNAVRCALGGLSGPQVSLLQQSSTSCGIFSNLGWTLNLSGLPHRHIVPVTTQGSDNTIGPKEARLRAENWDLEPGSLTFHQPHCPLSLPHSQPN